jgi:predicted RNA-binding protein with RPS1 domain
MSNKLHPELAKAVDALADQFVAQINAGVNQGVIRADEVEVVMVNQIIDAAQIEDEVRTRVLHKLGIDPDE